ncbi:hypothetical protein DRW41_16230 [Neobacillus piezotolerans]|uniref:Uncharacterized protein n=1 Tax=Neobacillus piezotolerans TaxID=2259171 RepID=A0A3D8GN42_9BACI|nr:hypothetical protein [Neobacillus piezotolerans]RDU35692.1 hypothetical protein DRW41_16230 [Neobacillus piezotolerans]
MNRIFGLLIISLSLLTTSIVLQIAWGINYVSIFLIIIVFILGILLLIPDRKNQKIQEEFVSDEEIEAELLKSDNKNK